MDVISGGRLSRHGGAFYHPDQPAKRFGQYLLDLGVLSAQDLLWARGRSVGTSLNLYDILSFHSIVPQAALDQHYADWLKLPLCAEPLDLACPELLKHFDPQRCLTLGVLPLNKQGHLYHLAVHTPEQFVAKDLRADLTDAQCQLQFCNETRLQRALQHLRDPDLSHRASHRVHETESCRTWGHRPNRRLCLMILLPLIAFICVLAWPHECLLTLTIWSILTLIIAATLKSAALLAYLWAPPLPNSRNHIPLTQLPRISVLVPLYKEPEVLRRLIQNLGELQYPTDRLQILILLEEEDTLTQAALTTTDLPPHMRALIVPDGPPRTKPRAMNYALDFCRGDIVGIYDAEDMPEPDQLLKVAHAMQNAPDDLAGVQGVLDFYNPTQNWIARCFTIEYASWFRVILPGMRRLGFAIPLGGTTVFCRRDILTRLGGWDAHNVTEDADLGIRLARHGYRIEMLPSTTFEEANYRPLPWVRQRSRWLKGYMATYLVHMRRPRLLWQQLGTWQFCGVQMHFVTALSQVLLAPLLWSFWLILFDLPHPLTGYVPDPLIMVLGRLFIGVELLTITIGFTATRKQHHRKVMPWVPTLHFYYPIAVFAAYKALIELIFVPFYWDKTQHGLSQPPTPYKSSPQASTSSAQSA